MQSVIRTLRRHIVQEQQAIDGADAATRAFLLADFHVCLAECMGHRLLCDVLRDLTARTTLAATLYQSQHDAGNPAPSIRTSWPRSKRATSSPRVNRCSRTSATWKPHWGRPRKPRRKRTLARGARSAGSAAGTPGRLSGPGLRSSR